MNVRNCRKCGRIFNYVSGMGICPTCKAAMEEEFIIVRDFVRENPRAGLQEISDTCDVEISQIHQWIREERLTFSKDSSIGLNCENCSTVIKTGRFCPSCKEKMAKNLGNSIQKPEEPQLDLKKSVKENPKMRFLDK